MGAIFVGRLPGAIEAIRGVRLAGLAGAVPVGGEPEDELRRLPSPSLLAGERGARDRHDEPQRDEAQEGPPPHAAVLRLLDGPHVRRSPS